MNISSLSVRRGVTFAMAYLILVGFGLYSLGGLGLDLYPDVSFPTVVVLTEYTGASPEDMETLVTRPIESGVSSVKGAKEIRSTSKQGVSYIEVRFDWGEDMDQAETEVRRALELVEGFLPDDVKDSMVFAFDPSMQPIVMMMISGPYPLDELRRIAEKEIEPRLARLEGIAAADTEGGLEREIRIELDPVKVAAHKLDVNQVIGTVYRENTQLPGGSVEQGTLDFTIQTTGKYQRVEDIGEVMVGIKPTLRGPVPVRLKDVARIEDTFYESQRMLEVDGEPAVWMIVRKQSGANTVKAARAVMDALPKIQRAAAADLEFKTIFNQATFINQSLGNLSSTGLIGIGITFLVLLGFLRHLRSAAIVSTAIPLSVIATFAVMYWRNMTLNVLSMAGLALAIGMLVDNAIVVLENIFRLREQGKGSWTSAIDGARTVSTAVMASTLTTVSVFVPVLFVPGIAGVLFKDMAVTICFSLLVSLVVALTFIPLASSRLLGSARAQAALEKARSKQRLFNALRSRYGQVLDWTLRRRWVVGLGVVGLLAGTAGLAIALPTEFVTEDDQSFVFVSVESPIGNNLHEAKRCVDEVAEVLEEVIRTEERKMIATDTGIGKGFVAIFAKGVHAGVIRVPLVAVHERERSQAEIEAAVRKGLKKVPGVKATIGMPFNMMGSAGDIEIQIRGHNLVASRAAGLELRDQLRALPEMAEVTFSMDDQKPEVRVKYDRRKMAELGISAAAVSNAISAYFMGRLAGRYAEGGDEYDILVRYGKEFRLDIDELRKMPVATMANGTVPLGNLAEVDVGLGPVDIARIDQGRYTTLVCTLHDEYVDADGVEQRKDLGGSIDRVTELLDAYPWPKDFSYYIGGSAEDFLTSFRYLGIALLVSVLLVYMVMASQFESLRQPFIIIFSVPLAAIGVVLMFTLTRSTMDISALVGVIMLVGIVVNNGIVMVDAANQFREHGLGRREAIANAARVRLRPVLMTSITTMLAMTPLALEIGEGSAGWGGMAKAVIGGLFAATFLTLFVVPTMYTLFARKVHRSPRQDEPPSSIDSTIDPASEDAPMSLPPPSGIPVDVGPATDRSP
jgi:HAE1 family hydrophobic/amphiphilic exporter-1